MTKSYTVLPVGTVAAGALCEHPATGAAPAVSCDSDAMEVMTDLTRSRPITAEPGVDIDSALERMKVTGVRLLFVIEADNRLAGVISSEDIQGEKPVQYQREVGVPRREIRVKDIMVRADKLEALDVEDVRRARVGDLVSTLKRYGRQHVLVRERTRDGDVVCGLFSARQVGRQLGMSMEPTGIAGTFSELEAALAS